MGADGDGADYIPFDLVNEAIRNSFHFKIIGGHVREVSPLRHPGLVGVLEDGRDMSRHDLVQERLVM